MEKQLQQLEISYPDKARGVSKFNVPLAHIIIAGADFILVPSRFEPCGLIQLQAMRYGTVPIVALTGGLVDTVKEVSLDFRWVPSMLKALAVYGTQAFTKMIKNCMAQDLSWKGPAKKWEEVLLSLGVLGSEPGIDGEEIAPQAKENIATP
ncbi:granule bound starch synthase [Sesbania bispinosa]|nr:granule bound starch synthase [Sesbania bispinosa]